MSDNITEFDLEKLYKRSYHNFDKIHVHKGSFRFCNQFIVQDIKDVQIIGEQELAKIISLIDDF